MQKLALLEPMSLHCVIVEVWLLLCCGKYLYIDRTACGGGCGYRVGLLSCEVVTIDQGVDTTI